MNKLGKLCLSGLLAFVNSATAQSWENITGNVPGAISTSNLGPMDTDGTRLYVLGDKGVFVTSDGGTSFAGINAVASAGYTLDQYSFRFVGFANGEVWLGADPGSAAHSGNGGLATLHRLTPGGSTWTQSSAGFPILTINNNADDIAYDATTGTYYAMSPHGGPFVSTNGGNNWTLMNNGQGGIGNPASVVVNNGIAFTARPTGSVRVSSDQGATWTVANTPVPIFLNGAGHLVNHNGRIIFPFSNGNITYVDGVPVVHQGIVYTDDSGQTWNYVRNPAVSGADAQSDGTTVFFGTVHYSANGGVTTDVLDQTGLTGAGRRIIRVGNTLFAITANGLFRRNISSLDLRASTQIAVQPAQPPTLLEGDRHTFTVVAGGENLTYQWKKDHVNIPGATGASLTVDPATASDSGNYTVLVTGDFGTPASVTSDAVTLTVQIPEDGKDDPTFPQSPAARSTALLAVLDDGTVVENDANYLQRYGDQGRINQRTFNGKRFFFQILDSHGRLVLVEDQNASAGQVVRINPVSLEDDPTFIPFTIDANDGFTAAEEWPGRGYLLATERFAERNGIALDSLILIDYHGNLDSSFVVGDSADASFRRLITRIAVTEDGTIFTFSDDGLQKINPDGSNDSGFSPAQTANRLWPIRGNRVLIGSRVPWIMNTDGTRDMSFNPANLGFNRDIADIVEQLDGKFIAVGDFSSYGSDAIVDQIRLNADGTRDATFFDQEGYLFSGDATDVAYDPRGYAYLSPSSTSSSRSYQDSGKTGIVRLFTSRAGFGIWRQSAGGTVDRLGNVELSVIAFGDSLTYQWFKGGNPLSGETGVRLSISGYSAANDGSYTVQVSDGTNTATSRPMVLREIAEPVIISQPSDADLLLGDDHLISVGAEAVTGTSYQWRKNGVAITNATSRSLALTNLQFRDAGAYSVVISNQFGSATSRAANITVNEITGALVTAFTPSLNDEVWGVQPMPDGTAVIVGEFSTVDGVSHPRFTRLDKLGDPVSGIWSAASPGGANGIRMEDAERLASGKVLIAGDHTIVQGNSQNRLSRINADGTFDASFVGTSFNQAVQTVKELPDKKLLAGGRFSSPSQFLALLNEDGSHDSSFTVSLNDYPYHIDVQPDGRIIVAGAFTSLNGGSVNRIIRFNSDLTLDTSFNPPAINGTIYDFGIDGAGGIVIGGSFTQVGTEARNHVARLKVDGSLDTSFDTGTTFSSTVRAIAIQLNGKIVVGGQFLGRVKRLLANGRTDRYFSLGSAPSQFVYDLETTPDGCLWVVGPFTSPRQRVALYTTDKSDPAVLSGPDPVAVDLGGNATLSVNIYTTTTATYQWLKNGELIPGATDATYMITNAVRADAGEYSVVVNNDSGVATSQRARVSVLAEPVIVTDLPASYTAVTAGGITLSPVIEGRTPLTFTWKKDGTPLSNGGRVTGADGGSLNISDAELNDSGNYTLSVTNDLGGVTTRQVLVTVIEPPAGIRTGYDPDTLSFTGGDVYAIKPLSDGSLIVGGFFTQVNGTSRPYLAKIDAAGAFDATFTPVINSRIWDVDVDATDRITIAGDFTSVNGTSRSRVARLNADGTLDTTFNTAAGANSSIYTVTALGNGQVFIGGRFSSFAANSAQGQYGCLLNADGSLDTNFDLNPNHYVWDSAEVPGHTPRLLIGSQGTLVDGSNAYLRKVNLDGTLDDGFRPSLNGRVYEVMLEPDGKVVAAGQFSANNGLARFNTDGSLDSSFAISSSLSSSVFALARQLDGKILVGGSFTTFNGESRSRLARTQQDGMLDSQFDIGTGFNTGTIQTLLVTEAGKIWAGGGFTSYNGSSVNRLVQLNGDPVLLAITRQPRDLQVDLDGTINLEVKAIGTTLLGYQWHRNGTPISGATAATLTINNATRDHSGSYTVVVTNQSGSQTSDSARVIVQAEPIILSQPATVSVAAGSPVTFAVEALGAGELHHQWRRNGVPIADGTNASLTLTAFLTNSACYDVVITNKLGAITSLPAALGVYKAAGTIDASFDPGTGPNNTVFASAALPNGNLAIGGSFTSVNGVSRARFAVLDSMGNVVDLTASGGANPGFSQTVLSLAAQPDGKIIYGHNSGYGRLNADGTQDTGFNSSGNWTPKVAVHGNHAYFGGWYGNFERGLLRVDITTGQKDTAFSTKAEPSANQNIVAIAFQSDGKILAGEGFGGPLRRFLPDGTPDASFNITGIAVSNIQGLAVDADDRIWVAFSSQLVRLDKDGVYEFTATQIDRTIRDLKLINGRVYVAGDFFPSINGVNYRSFVRVSSVDGTVETSFGPIFENTSGYTIADAGNGKVYVGGQFSDPVARIARVIAESDATLAITCQPVGGTFDAGQPLHLTVGWTGGSPATYQWRFNDQNIPGATNQTFAIPMIGGTNAGAYKVIVTDASGNVTSDEANVTVNGAGVSFANWAADNNLPTGQAGPGDDADNDGVPNLVEFALGTNPTSAASKALPADRTVTVNNVKYPGVALIRRKGVAGANVEVKAFGSIPFNTEVTTVQEGAAEDLGDGTERIIIRASHPLDTAPVVFFLTRVRQE